VFSRNVHEILQTYTSHKTVLCIVIAVRTSNPTKSLFLCKEISSKLWPGHHTNIVGHGLKPVLDIYRRHVWLKKRFFESWLVSISRSQQDTSVWSTGRSCAPVKVKVKFTLRLAVYRQLVRLGVKPLETHDHRFFQLNSCCYSPYVTFSNEKMGLSLMNTLGLSSSVHFVHITCY
jgi:hypothetical protein